MLACYCLGLAYFVILASFAVSHNLFVDEVQGRIKLALRFAAKLIPAGHCCRPPPMII